MRDERGLGAAILGSMASFEVEPGESVRIKGTFVFGRAFPGFSGHFPGNPVLPAIVQLALPRVLASRFTGRELKPVTVERVKFKAVILPEEEVSVSLTLKESGNFLAGEFSIRLGEATAAQGRMVLAS